VDADDWELGLLMIGLHQFETEQILWEGAIAVLGVVCPKIDRMWWFDYPEDKPIT